MCSFFNPLKVSSKFPICNLPLRLDSYNSCLMDCTYCFSNNRLIGRKNRDSVPNMKWLKNKFVKVFDDKNVNKSNFLEVLLSNNITLHCGGGSDPFQYVEKYKGFTRDIIGLCNEYDLGVLFSTKSDSFFDVPVNPDLHSFQLSVSNTFNHFFECNVPLFRRRYAFYESLIDMGFNVGIRVQPYIHGVTDIWNIFELFGDACHFTIESLKLFPGSNVNPMILDSIGFSKEDFTNLGLLNVKPDIRLEYYQPIIDYLESNGYSYSIADNDLHYLGNNVCCCGDALIGEGIGFCNGSLIREYGSDYCLGDVFCEANEYLDCVCSSLYNSSRRNGCKTVRDFFVDRFERGSAIFSPKFQYNMK